jgi:hypothetical protein
MKQMIRMTVIGYWTLKVPRQKYHYGKRNNVGRDRNLQNSDILEYSLSRRGIYAKGKGIFMIKEDVNEIATWTGQGIAHYSGNKRRDVGSVFCRGASTNGLLAFLNSMVGAFEYEVDENGNFGGKIWE